MEAVSCFRRKMVTQGCVPSDVMGVIVSQFGCQHVLRTSRPSGSLSERPGTKVPHQGSWTKRMSALVVLSNMVRAAF